MDTNEAIAILRGEISPSSVLHRPIAEQMGSEALRAWAWVERTGCAPEGCGRNWQVYSGFGGYGEGPTPLAAVVDAMAKEKTNG